MHSDKYLWEFCKASRFVLNQLATDLGIDNEAILALRCMKFRKGQITDVEINAVWRALHTLMRPALESESTHIATNLRAITECYKYGHLPRYHE